jgi:hypothetical protein
MPSSSILSYPDIRQVMDRAIDSEKGVRLKFDTVKSAQTFVFRCNTFRSLDRKENKKIYPDETHSLHGRSIYDTLQVKRREEHVEIVPVKGYADIEDIP